MPRNHHIVDVGVELGGCDAQEGDCSDGAVMVQERETSDKCSFIFCFILPESRSIIVSSYVPSLHTLLIYLYEVTNNDKCDCLEQRVSRSVFVLNQSFLPPMPTHC